MYYSIMIDSELEYLKSEAAKLEPGATYVELGSFALGTVGRIAQSFPHLKCEAVDMLQHGWLDYPEHPTKTYLQELYPEQEWSVRAVRERIDKIQDVSPNLTFHHGMSRQFVFPNAGLQFIDADHSYEQVTADFWHCWAQARPNSMIIGHDLQIDGTHEAVRDIAQVLKQTAQFPAGSMWSFQKVSP